MRSAHGTWGAAQAGEAAGRRAHGAVVSAWGGARGAAGATTPHLARAGTHATTPPSAPAGAKNRTTHTRCRAQRRRRGHKHTAGLRSTRGAAQQGSACGRGGAPSWQPGHRRSSLQLAGAPSTVAVPWEVQYLGAGRTCQVGVRHALGDDHSGGGHARHQVPNQPGAPLVGAQPAQGRHVVRRPLVGCPALGLLGPPAGGRSVGGRSAGAGEAAAAAVGFERALELTCPFGQGPAAVCPLQDVVICAILCAAAASVCRALPGWLPAACTAAAAAV